MKNEKEFSGTLCGFDDYVNIVLEDVTEYDVLPGSPEGTAKKISELDSILLNGNNIAMLIPHSSPEDAAKRVVGPQPV